MPTPSALGESSSSQRRRPGRSHLLGWETPSAADMCAAADGRQTATSSARMPGSSSALASTTALAPMRGRVGNTAGDGGPSTSGAARGGRPPRVLAKGRGGGARWQRGGGSQAALPPPPPPSPPSGNDDDQPNFAHLAVHRPLALIALVPTPVVLFMAGAVAGAVGKTLTAPLDRVKLLLQTRGGLETGALAAAARAGGVAQAFLEIGRQEGIAGYWRGNVPQILKVLPYSATQLCAYEALKRALADKEDGSLSLPARLLAGATAGMVATAATHPLDTLRLRMAVDPASPTLAAAARTLLASGGPRALYRGLGASLAGIAPYMAIELAAFDVLGAAAEKAKAAKDANGGVGGGILGVINGFGRGATAALIATSVCYPLDTARRRVQLAGAAAGGDGLITLVRRVAATEGPGALYRGFWPNAAKNLPNKGVKLGTFDAAKKLLARAQAALDDERGAVRKKKASLQRARVQLG